MDAGSNYIRMLIAIVCSLFLTRAMAVHLGIEEFGRWSLLTSIFGLALLVDLGLGNVVVKTAGSKDADSNVSDVLSTVFVSLLILSAIAFFAATAVAHSFMGSSSRNSNLAVLILGFRFTVAALPWTIFRSILFARGGLFASNLIQSTVTVLYSVAGYVALSHGSGILALAVVTLAAALVEASLMVWLVKCRHPGTRIGLKFSFKALRPALSLGLASLLINVAGLILLKTDPIIVKSFLPFSQVALYAVALRIAENIFLLCKQLVNALTPQALQIAAANDLARLSQLYRKATRMVFAAGVALYVPCFLLGESAIRMWLSDAFAPSSHILDILLGAMVLSIPQLVASNLMTFSGHHRLVAKMIVGGSVINVLTSIALVRIVGVNGVAYGTLVATLVVDLGILLPVASKHFGLSCKQAIGDLIRSSALPAVAQGACLFGLRLALPATSLVGIILQAGIGVMVFGIAFFVSSMSQAERQSIIRLGRATKSSVPEMEAAA